MASLSGGSTLTETRGGVVKYLEEKKIGVAYGGMRIPIVPAAAIFDLGVGDSRIRPGADCGYRAAMGATTNPVQEGSVGAGAGATLGKFLGMSRAMKGGVGSAATTTADGTIIAALVVANPLGDVIDPATGKIVADVRKAQVAAASRRAHLDPNRRTETLRRRQHNARRHRDECDARQGASFTAGAVGRRWLGARNLADSYECRR
jgi:L-aminopeptidase/D-esterase-like protein